MAGTASVATGRAIWRAYLADRAPTLEPVILQCRSGAAWMLDYLTKEQATALGGALLNVAGAKDPNADSTSQECARELWEARHALRCYATNYPCPGDEFGPGVLPGTHHCANAVRLDDDPGRRCPSCEAAFKAAAFVGSDPVPAKPAADPLARWSAFSDKELQALHWELDSEDPDVVAIAEQIDEELRDTRGFTWRNARGWVKA